MLKRRTATEKRFEIETNGKMYDFTTECTDEDFFSTLNKVFGADNYKVVSRSIQTVEKIVNTKSVFITL